MCENGKHFFYFVRLITFSYYSLLKEAILQKKKNPKMKWNQMQSIEQKVKRKNGVSLYFLFDIASFFKETLLLQWNGESWRFTSYMQR